MVKCGKWLAAIGLALSLSIPAYGSTVLQVLEVAAEAQDTTSSEVFAPISDMELAIVVSGSAVAVSFDGDFILCNESGTARHVGGAVRLLRNGVEIRKFEWAFWTQPGKCVSIPGNIFEIDVNAPPPGSYYEVEWASIKAVKTSMTINRRRLKLVELR